MPSPRSGGCGRPRPPDRRSLLSLAPAGAEKVDVGKQPDDRGDQDAINQLLVDRAREGLRVVRLKGGDPFVFGRGGEEALVLRSAGIPFEVVPGVTSAIAVPAYAGVPVTHRGLVTAFTVVAGHTRSVDSSPAGGGTNWEALAAGRRYDRGPDGRRPPSPDRRAPDGRRDCPPRPRSWPCSGAPNQNRRRFARPSAVLASAELGPPVTIVIGEVAGLDLGWYRKTPVVGQDRRGDTLGAGSPAARRPLT